MSIMRKIFKVKLKNNGADRQERNFIGETLEYFKNCCIGEEVKNDDGTVVILKDSKKYYNKKKVVAGSITLPVAAIGTGALAAYGIDKVRNKDSESDIELIDMGDVEVIDLPEEGTETTNE